jgi:F-type H+-transporting ATPase subunit j
MLIALVVTCQICILDTHPALVLLAQVFRPLWPFFAASGITYFLVSKAQDVAVRCELFHPSETRPKTQLADTRAHFSPTL